LKAEQLEAQQQFFSTSTQVGGVSNNNQPPDGDGSVLAEQQFQQDAANVTPVGSNRFFAFHRSNLPARCAAFMKELLLVPERDRRLGLISKVRCTHT
jgi:hypothetical protein